MPEEPRLITVFQAVNADLKEVYLGCTEQPMGRLGASFWDDPPKRVAHWKPEHTVSFRALEYSLSRRDAKEYIAAFKVSAALSTWKLLREYEHA